ncbi:tail-specific protease [Escherichia coli]|uniref:Tail-specific protease n=1 Tax=Escherichia coli TaxID=562 RepID=A0A2X1NLB5_ECOLX|nr:tail-specific protease [Escherichia coli]
MNVFRLEDRAVKMSVKTVGKEKVGVLDIPGFYVGLTDDVKVQLQETGKTECQQCDHRLRSNGGGALTEAVSLSGLFIPAGPIVQVRDNNGKVREDSDTDGQVFYKGPLVVLVTVSVLRLQKSLPRQCRITVVRWLWVNRRLVKAPFSNTVH